MISVKSVFLHLHILGVHQARVALAQLAKWQQMLAVDSDAKSTANVSDMTESTADTHSSKSEKNWDKIIKEVLRSNTHL